MTSRSSQVSAERPFYDRHADAYDALITDPVEPWVEAVHDRLLGSGRAAARVLDAGCGTGFDAVMCRGVLNDLVLDEERVAAFGSFAALCGPGERHAASGFGNVEIRPGVGRRTGDRMFVVTERP